MSYGKFFRTTLPVIASLTLGFAPVAFAQSTMAPSSSTMAPSSSTMAPSSNTMAPAGTMAPAKPAKPAKTASSSSSTLPASEQFTTVAAAQASCAGDTVVWSTLSKSKSYHTATSKYFGKTKKGAYVCQKAADAAGFHAAKN